MQISQFKVPPINWATNGNLIKEHIATTTWWSTGQQSCVRKECTCQLLVQYSLGILVNNLIANITINSPWHSAKYEISGSQLTYISVYLSFKSHSQFMRLPLRSDRFNIFALQHNPTPPAHDVHQIYLCLLSHCVPLFDYIVVIPSVPISSPCAVTHCTVHWILLGPNRRSSRRTTRRMTMGRQRHRNGTNTGVYIDGRYACPEKNYNFQFNLLFN